MDGLGVWSAVIAPEDREMAVHNHHGNQRILAIAKQSPGRFIPACTVSPWFGPHAIKELRQAVLAGARMLVLAPALQGFTPTDDLVDPLMVEAGRLDVPVYFHTGPHSHGSPAQVYYVAKRHRDTRFILGHGGSTDYSYDLGPVMEMKLSNLWFELSFVRPWAMPAIGKAGDHTKLIFGSSSPRNQLELEYKFFDQNWPQSKHPGTYGPNLLDALQLDAGGAAW